MAVSQTIKFILLLMLILSFFVQVNGKENHYEPLFYQIDYKGSTAFLLGSIHVGSEAFYPLPSRINQAFIRASGLVVEAKPDSDKMAQLIKQYGMQPLDMKKDKIWLKYCRLNALFCQQISMFSPWLQAMQISLRRFEKLGLFGRLGVDMTLIDQNKNRALYELESAEQQLTLLSSFSASIQKRMLDEAINTSDADMLLLIDAWRQGNKTLLIELIENQLIEKRSKTDFALINTLLWQRNKKMAQQILDLFHQDLNHLFVVVGVGHLVGDKSIQNELIKQGASIQNCWKIPCF